MSQVVGVLCLFSLPRTSECCTCMRNAPWYQSHIAPAFVKVGLVLSYCWCNSMDVGFFIEVVDRSVFLLSF
jgi:hypothetical protein